MSDLEKDYYSSYSKIVSDYSNKATKCELDLTTGLNPPDRLLVQVRVLVDLGELELPDSGIVQLHKNTIHYLYESEAENFLRRGEMELLG